MVALAVCSWLLWVPLVRGWFCHVTFSALFLRCWFSFLLYICLSNLVCHAVVCLTFWLS